MGQQQQRLGVLRHRKIVSCCAAPILGRRVTPTPAAAGGEKTRPRKRPRANLTALSGVVPGKEDRAGAHRAGAADAERARGEFPREVARRMLERELVREFVRGARQDRSLEEGVQRRAPAQQFGVSSAEGVRAPSCGSAVAYGSLRAATRSTAAWRSYTVRQFECRMIPCAEPGGRSPALSTV